jgi:sec-independent protein translocase protein TatA
MGYRVHVYLLTPWHIVLLVLVVLLLFGSKRLPTLGRSLGSGVREFKNGITDESHKVADPQPALPPAGATADSTPTKNEHAL